MEFFTLYTLPPLLSSILFLFLGAIVYLYNRKSISNITFALLCFVTFWWQFFCFVQFNTQSEILASYLVKVVYIGIIFIPIFFFHFFLSFLREVSKFDRYLLYFSYLMGLIFEITLLTTNYFIKGFYKYFFGFYSQANFLHPLYLLLLTILALRIFYLSFSKLKATKEKFPIEYEQTKNLLIGLMFYILASSDFLLNYGVEFYPFGFLFILIFLGITAYTIIKHRLFGIKVILTEILVGIIAILLLVNILVSKTLFDYSWKGITFVLFLVFGYYLIKATHREARQKEILEEKVKERTKELQTTHEEMKKEKERLERLYKATVGRELRMIELKGEIKDRKEKIKELEEKLKTEKNL